MYLANIKWYDVISMTGVLIILVTYFLLQSERIDARSYLYSILNFIGSMMILYSLFYDWNLSAVIIEVCWAVISLFGLVKRYFENK